MESWNTKTTYQVLRLIGESVKTDDDDDSWLWGEDKK